MGTFTSFICIYCLLETVDDLTFHIKSDVLKLFQNAVSAGRCTYVLMHRLFSFGGKLLFLFTIELHSVQLFILLSAGIQSSAFASHSLSAKVCEINHENVVWQTISLTSVHASITFIILICLSP